MDKKRDLKEMQIQGQLVPVLREGADIVKMILFKELKPYLTAKYPDKDARFISRLSGAVLNDLFGIENLAAAIAAFKQENQHLITGELEHLAVQFPELRIPLTDALRIQFLCDSREGINSESTLSKANTLGILIVDREIPLPKFFMNLVRKLGVARGIIDPQSVLAIPEDDPTDLN